jgi:flagellar protein FliS
MLHNLAINWERISWEEEREASPVRPHEIWPEEKSSSTGKPAAGNHSFSRVMRLNKMYLIRLLYDGAIDYLSRAQNASRTGDMAGKARNIDRALNIIHELSRSLRRTEDNELAETIGKLYIFWIKSLTLEKSLESVQSLEKIIGMMTSIRGICLPKSEPMVRNILVA